MLLPFAIVVLWHSCFFFVCVFNCQKTIFSCVYLSSESKSDYCIQTSKSMKDRVSIVMATAVFKTLLATPHYVHATFAASTALQQVDKIHNNTERHFLKCKSVENPCFLMFEDVVAPTSFLQMYNSGRGVLELTTATKDLSSDISVSLLVRIFC